MDSFLYRIILIYGQYNHNDVVSEFILFVFIFGSYIIPYIISA